METRRTLAEAIAEDWRKLRIQFEPQRSGLIVKTGKEIDVMMKASEAPKKLRSAK